MWILISFCILIVLIFALIVIEVFVATLYTLFLTTLLLYLIKEYTLNKKRNLTQRFIDTYDQVNILSKYVYNKELIVKFKNFMCLF